MKDNKKLLVDDWDNLEKELRRNKTIEADFKEIDDYLNIIVPIIKRRKELGLSQRELAKLCDFPQSTIGRIETMKTIGSVTNLIKITNALGLTITIK